MIHISCLFLFSCFPFRTFPYNYDLLETCVFLTEFTSIHNFQTVHDLVQPVSYKRYNCFLLLVYTINLSLSRDLVYPPPMGTFYMKHALALALKIYKMAKSFQLFSKTLLNIYYIYYIFMRFNRFYKIFHIVLNKIFVL